MQTNPQDEVSSTLQKFQDGYTVRDVTKSDEVMQLFVQDETIEMIGVGASKRAAKLVYHYEKAANRASCA